MDREMTTNAQLTRIEVFRALVGSHNYNLNDETSDKDFKIFVLPTFDDLYKGKMYSDSKIGKDFDYDVHDIRKLSELFWKANINFLEVLYSKEHHGYFLDLFKIYSLKDQLATMNLPYLYNACKGMHFEKMKRLDKPTEGTAHLIEKYGYNTKEALHAYRVLDFITRFAYTDFTDFKWAMTYNEETRAEMLAIKQGRLSKEQFIEFVTLKFNHFEKFARAYGEQKPNEELKEHLDSIIYNMIRRNIV